MALSPAGGEMRDENVFKDGGIFLEATPEKKTGKRVPCATTPPKKSARKSIDLRSKAWGKMTEPSVDCFLTFLKGTTLFIRSRDLFLSTLGHALATRPEERGRIQHTTIRALLDSLDNAKDMAAIDQKRLEEDLESIASTLDEHSVMLEQERKRQAMLEKDIEERRTKLDEIERRLEECAKARADTGRALRTEHMRALVTPSASKEVKEGSEEDLKELENMLKNAGWKVTQLKALERARKKAIARGKLTPLQQSILSHAQEELSKVQCPPELAHDMLRANFDKCRKQQIAKMDARIQQKDLEAQIRVCTKELRIVQSSISQFEKLNIVNTDQVSSLEEELSALKEQLALFEDAKLQLLTAIGPDYYEFYSRYTLK